MEFSSKEERDKFIERYIPLVQSRVMDLNNRIYNEDLFQVGCEFLIKAADRYDETLGFTFVTYAYQYITGGIKTYKMFDKLGKPTRIDGVFKYHHFDSLDRELKYEYDSNEFEKTYKDVKDVFGQESFEKYVVDDLYINELLNNNFSKRQIHIFELHVNGKYQREIGEELGISRSYVSRIIKQMIKKLKILMDIKD